MIIAPPGRVERRWRGAALTLGLTLLTGCTSPADIGGGLVLDVPPPNHEWTLPLEATAWDAGAAMSIDCNDVPSFTTLLLPTLVTYCTECHAEELKAYRSYNLLKFEDPSPEAQAEMCARSRALVKPNDFYESQLLVQPDPNHPNDHTADFKFENPADQAVFETAVKNWLDTELGGIPGGDPTGGADPAGGADPTGGADPMGASVPAGAGSVPVSEGVPGSDGQIPGGGVPAGNGTPGPVSDTAATGGA